MGSESAVPTTTLAASLHGPGDVRLARRDIALPGVGEILVAVAYTGVCGSELHAIRDPDDLGGTVAKDGLRLGHEYSGIVRAVGPDVTELVPGDAVACRPRFPCGDCRSCRAGDIAHCTSWVRVREGAWTEAIVIPRVFASRIPEGTSLRQAALTEPLACAMRAVDRSGLVAGEHVLVVGGGPMGLLVARVAVHAGAARVFVSEPIEYRRALATELGAVALDPADGDIATQVREATDGAGVEVAFEAAGLAATVEESIAAVGVGGRVVIVGVASAAAVARVHPQEIFAREITIVGAWGIETTFERALEQVSTLGVDPIITHELPLEELDDAIGIARSGQSGKILLRPRSGVDAASQAGTEEATDV